MALPGWLRRSPRTETRGAEVPPPPNTGSASSLADLSIALFGGRLDTKSLTTAKEQVAAYQGWVYAAVQALSRDVRKRPWKLVDGSDQQLERQQMNPVLLRPNTHQTWKDITELAVMHMDLTGKAFWHAIRGQTGSGVVAGFQLIPPHWVTDYRMDTMGRLVEWQVSVPGRAATWREADDVYLMRWPHPEDLFGGASPVQAFAHSYNVDLYARAYTSSVLRNNAQIPGILSSDQELNQEQSDTIRERWMQRYGKGGGTQEGPAVLGKGAAYQKLSMSISDLEFASLADLSMEQVFAIYGVPPTKVGIARKGGTLAMSREEENTYAENALVPRLDKIEDVVERFILPLLGEEDREFHYESPIKKDVASIHQRAEAALRAGTITVNSFLEETEREPLGSEGEVFYLPLGVRIVDKLEPRDPLSPGVVPPPNTEPDDEDEDEDEPETRGISDDRAELSAVQFRQVQTKGESSLRAEARKLFSQEAKAIIAKLKEVVRTNAELYDKRHGWGMQLVQGREVPVALVRAVGDDIVEDALAASRPSWEAGLEKAWLANMREGWRLLLQDGVGEENVLAWDIYQEEAARVAAAEAGKKVKGILETTQQEVAGLISEGIQEGTSVADLAKQIGEKFDTYKGSRSQTIARTETATAVNEGKFTHAEEAAAEYGLTYLKTWLPTEGSENTRPHHRAEAILPYQTIPLAQDFVVNGENMQRPQDARGSAGNVINCRCTLVMEVE